MSFYQGNCILGEGNNQNFKDTDSGSMCKCGPFVKVGVYEGQMTSEILDEFLFIVVLVGPQTHSVIISLLP